MASKNYIPNKDADFSNWLATLVAYILANYAALGLTQAQADALDTLRGAFGDAFANHLTEIQTARSVCQTKDQTRAAVEAAVRTIVKQLQANPAITDAQKEAMGITVPKTGKTPVPAPVSRPVPQIEAIEEFEHVLRIFDDGTNRPAKPAGVDGAEVWLKVVPQGGTAPVDPSELSFDGVTSTTKLTRTFDAADAGKTAYYRLRWVNPKGEPGPWGTQVAGTIAA